MDKLGEKIIITSIGVIHTEPSDDQVREGHRDVLATVELFPELEEALEGLEGYSHIFIVSYLHKLRSEQIGPLRVKPIRAMKRGFKLDELPSLGVFALDSPSRPNPLGLTLARLLKRNGNTLFVSGVNLFDGTPVIDIKAYQPEYEAKKYTLPEWYVRIMSKNGHV